MTESFSSSALRPGENPAFPASPSARSGRSSARGRSAVRRNSGSLPAHVRDGRAQVSLAGYFFGKQDDSTFLSDAFFGNSMLLPNKDLDAGYQKIDLSGSYRIHPRLRWYITVENAFDQDSRRRPASPRCRERCGAA